MDAAAAQIPDHALIARPSREKTLQHVLKKLESSGRYGIKKGQYLGAYQMGPGALIDAGYKSPDGEWTGKDGVVSEEYFLETPRAQDIAQTEWFKVLGDRMRRRGTVEHIGKVIPSKTGEVRITGEGLKMASHLVGDKAVHDWLAGKRDEPVDGNGTPASKYMKLGEWPRPAK